MRRAAAIALLGLWALPAASQPVLPVVYRCVVDGGGVRTSPPAPLAFTQFTLHWRSATQDAPATLKILHEYFSNAPLTRAAAAAGTIGGSYAGTDAKGRPRTATVAQAAQDDRVLGLEVVEPFDLAGQPARFDLRAHCTRQ